MKERVRAEASVSSASHRQPFFSRAGSASFFPGPRVQAKLKIGPANDAFEREADRVADQVVSASAPESSVQRTCTECQEELQRQPLADEEREEEVLAGGEAQLSLKPLPTSPVTDGGAGSALPSGAESALSSLSGSGVPLPEPSSTFFERSFGVDFGQVRLHTDDRAASLAASLSARAFTHGHDIVFGPGEYRPDSLEGRRLLAHELTHVTQQRGAVQRVMRSPACDCSKIGRAPTSAETTDAKSKYPNLVDGDWCVTGPATPTYNCFAWSVGNTSSWIDTQIDSVYGNKDGTLSVSDFDSFYFWHGLKPVTNATPSNPVVALFANSAGGEPTHAARRSAHSCPGAVMFESKRGKNIRIVHVLSQLEGGLYGNVIRYYV